MIIPMWLLLVAVMVFAHTTLRRRPYATLIATLLFLPFPGEWGLPIRLDPLDLALGAFFVWRFVLSRDDQKEAASEPSKLPLRLTWVLTGLLMTTAYLTAPFNQQFLTDPVRIGYQIYRYGWKYLLFFPVAVFLIRTIEERWRVALGLVGGGLLVSVPAIFQGYSGIRAGGFFGPNALGGILLAPMTISISALLSGVDKRERWFHIISLIIMTRAMLFTGSRSAFVGLLLSVLVMVFRMPSRNPKRFVGVLVLALFGLAALFLLVPDLADRPNVKRMLTIFQASEQDTLQWRMNERWAHFFEAALENPWLGRGHDVELEDLDRGAGNALTPHNSYLSYALIYGFPATILMSLLLLRSAARGFFAYRRLEDPVEARLALASMASVLAIMTHAMGDGILQIGFISMVAFTLAGFNLSLKSVRKPEPAASTIRSRRTMKNSRNHIAISEF